MDRYWFLTWTTYGSWLPGDRRGSTSRVREAGGAARRNARGEAPAPRQAARERYARNAMKGAPVRLNARQARSLRNELATTAQFRGWTLLAAAIMRTHVHVVVGVVGVVGDPAPSDILRDFKRRGSVALNRDDRGAEPRDDRGAEPRRWWTRGGSTLRLERDENVLNAARYVRDQPYPLVMWVHPRLELK